MIIIAGFIEFTKDDYIAAKKDIIELENLSRGEEGCIYYSLAVANQSNEIVHITLLEKWKNQFSIDLHAKSPWFKTFASKHLPKAKSADIKAFEIASEKTIV